MIFRVNHPQRLNGNKWLFSSMILLSVMGCATTPYDSPVGLDKDHFKNTVVINEDMGSSVVFSTIRGFQRRQGEQSAVWDDNFLRGFIDKRTRAKTFQVYNVIYYGGSGTHSGWRHFMQASYHTAEGMRLTPTKILTETQDCAPLAVYGSCVYNEQVVFKVDEAFLKTVADSYSQNHQSAWQYQLIPTTGNQYEDSMVAAEVAGLLARMDEYLRQFSPLGKRVSSDIDGMLAPEPLITIPPPTAKPPFAK